MAKLKCAMHDRRVAVLSSTVVHTTQDNSNCDSETFRIGDNTYPRDGFPYVDLKHALNDAKRAPFHATKH